MIVIGTAALRHGSLRCTNPRSDYCGAGLPCDTLLCRANRDGEVAGKFKCRRCKAEVECIISPRKIKVADA